MKLSDIIKQQAEYTRNSGYTVVVDNCMPTVAIIEESTGETVWFLQGDDAQKWCDETESTYNKVGDMSLDDVYHAAGVQYIDSLD